MAQLAIKTLYFHEGPGFHMQGKNFGNRIDIQQGVRMYYDREHKEIHLEYKGKVSGLPSISAKNWDYIDVPADVTAYFGKDVPIERAPHGRPLPTHNTFNAPVITEITVPYPSFDPNDAQAAAEHRAKVRAASMNSNRAAPLEANNETLIQQSRDAAMGVKHQKTAQVQTAQQVGQAAAVTAKPKAMNHAQLKAQVAQEMKE